jgi:hypothetical protein
MAISAVTDVPSNSLQNESIVLEGNGAANPAVWDNSVCRYPTVRAARRPRSISLVMEIACPAYETPQPSPAWLSQSFVVNYSPWCYFLDNRK